jgi:hypothetical protein
MLKGKKTNWIFLFLLTFLSLFFSAINNNTSLIDRIFLDDGGSALLRFYLIKNIISQLNFYSLFFGNGIGSSYTIQTGEYSRIISSESLFFELIFEYGLLLTMLLFYCAIGASEYKKIKINLFNFLLLIINFLLLPLGYLSPIFFFALALSLKREK